MNNDMDGASSRRGWIARALAAVSTIAVARALPDADSAAEVTGALTCPPGGGPPASGAALPEIGEIARGADGVLRATITVEDESGRIGCLRQILPTPLAAFPRRCAPRTRRCDSSRARLPAGRVWPVVKGVPAPGPTLRARIGDQVQITLLNHVNVKDFPKTLDQAEQGISKGCDVSTTLIPDANGVMKQVQVYPGADKEPDCFHGSSSANLHFHGFHISPNIVRGQRAGAGPAVAARRRARKPVVSEASVRASFRQVFEHAAMGHGPAKWADLPPAYTGTQQKLLQDYDKALPPGVGKLWPADQKAIAAGQWPQFYVGAYPYSFQITPEQSRSGRGCRPPSWGSAPARTGITPISTARRR